MARMSVTYAELAPEVKMTLEVGQLDSILPYSKG